MVQRVDIFLATFATKVRKNDDFEMMLDNNFIIEWDNKEYYIPKDNMMYTEDDEKLVNYLDDYRV